MVKEGKGKYTYFLSDLHLGASYMKDSREREKRIVSFLDSIKENADSIFLLGDILDYWYEYKHVVPRGYVRFFGKLAELADSGVKIVWMKGNHDIWLFDYFPEELGIEIADGYIIEKLHGYKCFLSHGDGVGKLKPSFRFIRGVFRNRICQRLYAGIHPRWTVPFAYGWSNHSRMEGDKKPVGEDKILRNIKEFSENFSKEHPDIRYFIYGHAHVVAKEKISGHAEMIVLGEWIKTFSYGRLNEEGLELLKFNLDFKKT